MGLIINLKTQNMRQKKFWLSLGSIVFTLSMWAQQRQFSGIVKDDTNSPLPGASVIVKGTLNGALTGGGGEFSIEANVGDTLVISFMGMEDEILSLYDGMPVINLQMKVALGEELEEIVVVATGYDNINKRNFTGSAVTLKTEDVKMDGIVDVSRMIEGKVAGSMYRISLELLELLLELRLEVLLLFLEIITLSMLLMGWSKKTSLNKI